MRRDVKLWQDVLNHEVAAVLHSVGVHELDVEFVAGLGHDNFVSRLS